jgi:hypothetical protein
VTATERYDIAVEDVDWARLLGQMAGAGGFDDMLGAVLASGALVTT